MQVLTNQEFTYRQSPTESDGLAKITDIKGNTIVWNQIFIPQHRSNSGIQSNVIQDGNDYSVRILGTATANAWLRMDATGTLPVGHKFLLDKGSTSDLFDINNDNNGLLVDFSAKTKIGTITTANKYIYIFVKSGTTIDVTVKPILIDLTRMFGSGNEPTSVSDFTSLFPLSYYSYQSTLLPFKGTGIKTTGTNLIDYATIEQGSLDPASGTTYPNNARVRTPFIHLNQGTYTITSTNGFPVVIYMYYEDYAYDSVNAITAWQTTPKVFTMPHDGYVKLAFKKNDESAITPSEITGERMYNNNTESVTSLPILTYFPNGMKSAGNVYDELTESKAITRIGQITINGSYNAYLSELTNCVRISLDHGRTDVKYPNSVQASNYLPFLVNFSQDSEHFYMNGASAIIFILKSKCGTTAESVKAYLNSNPLTVHYELATPTETSFTTASLVTENAEMPYPFFKTYEGGTEQILPENGSVPTTAPIICDLKYSSGVVQVTTYPNPEQGGETTGDGWYLVGEEATVNALPNEHYAFNNWVLDGEIVSTDPEYTFEVSDE